MKKANLLAKLAILIAATDHIQEDTELGFVFISAEDFPTRIRSDFLPNGKIERTWHIKGEAIAETVEAYGCEFIRIKQVEMVMP
jgi:hypothetical protein